MQVDPSAQPGLEPVRHPDTLTGPKPENSAYGNYGGPPYGSSPQNSYNSPQHSYTTPTTVYGNGATGDAYAPQVVEEKPNHSGGRRICGIAAVTFGLLVALIVCILAAAIGGGVGGTIAVNNAKTACLADSAVTMSQLSAALASATGGTKTTSSVKSAGTTSGVSSSSTSKTTSAAGSATQPWGAVGTDIGLSGCPGDDKKIYTSTIGGLKFKMFCNQDIPGFDLMQTLVTTMGLCMEACASWNAASSTSVKCKSIAFIPSDIDGSNGQPVDCYLKSTGNATLLAPNTYVVDYGIIQ